MKTEDFLEIYGEPCDQKGFQKQGRTKPVKLFLSPNVVLGLKQIDNDNWSVILNPKMTEVSTTDKGEEYINLGGSYYKFLSCQLK